MGVIGAHVGIESASDKVLCGMHKGYDKRTNRRALELLANNEQLLANYNDGRSRKTAGNILLWGGLGSMVGYLGRGFYLGVYEFSSPANILGLSAVLVAIPVKIGFSKKIKRAVSLVNEDFKKPTTGFNIESTSFVSNANGFGISITF